jgi:alkanesulfonate monooxygenase SsuD/methylene tetrahydromethanopterin reductase-like flavin-dependent oxidoreductase (luciferase family)
MVRPDGIPEDGKLTDERVRLIRDVWRKVRDGWRPEYGDVFNVPEPLPIPDPQPTDPFGAMTGKIATLQYRREYGIESGVKLYRVICEGLVVEKGRRP